MRFVCKRPDGRQFEVGNAILSKTPFKGTEEHVVFGEYEVAKSLDECQNSKNSSGVLLLA